MTDTPVLHQPVNEPELNRGDPMVWIGIAIGVGMAALLALLALVGRRRAYRLASTHDQSIDDVDPLFTTGIALAGAGVALALTVDPFMYLMFVVGMILMAVGGYRTRQGRDGWSDRPDRPRSED